MQSLIIFSYVQSRTISWAENITTGAMLSFLTVASWSLSLRNHSHHQMKLTPATQVHRLGPLGRSLINKTRTHQRLILWLVCIRSISVWKYQNDTKASMKIVTGIIISKNVWRRTWYITAHELHLLLWSWVAKICLKSEVLHLQDEDFFVEVPLPPGLADHLGPSPQVNDREPETWQWTIVGQDIDTFMEYMLALQQVSDND